jgi:hypothetical protein
MVFALARKDGRLAAFASEQELRSHCEPADVEGGAWLFFAEDGSPLQARFELPKRKGIVSMGTSGYALQRPMSGKWLQEHLDQVKSVQGCGLASRAELAELLKINRGKRAEKGI